MGVRVAPAGVSLHPKVVVALAVSLLYRWRASGRSDLTANGYSAAAIPNRLEQAMNHVLVAAKAALGASLALGFAVAPHSVAHAEPGTRPSPASTKTPMACRACGQTLIPGPSTT